MIDVIAFVVYCEADSEWVHNTFVRKMENEANILLCIHQSDFDIGSDIATVYIGSQGLHISFVGL
jgi:DNA primase catalytic subunit